jgi:hypothetical protein
MVSNGSQHSDYLKDNKLPKRQEILLKGGSYADFKRNPSP